MSTQMPANNIDQVTQTVEMHPVPQEQKKDANFIVIRTGVFLGILAASVTLLTFTIKFVYDMGKDVGHSNFDKEKNTMADSIRTLNTNHASYVDSIEAENAKLEDAKAQEIIKQSVQQKRAEKLIGKLP